MTAITTYPLDGIQYDAKDAAAYFAPRTSGVYSAENCFTVTAAGGYTVRVSSGIGWVHPSDFEGYSIVKTEADTLTLSVADATRPRIDRIVLRYDAAARKTLLQVLEGSPDSNPTAPAISRTALVYDLVLCDILRPAGSTSITAGNLTDTRLDESLCGVMRDAVEGIPTDALLAAAKARIAELEETASASAKQADASQKAAAASEKNAAGSAKASKASESEAKQALEETRQTKDSALADIETARAQALDDVASATETSKTNAEKSASEAAKAETSAGAAATSEGNSKTSEEAAAESKRQAAALLKAVEEYYSQVRTITIGAMGWYATPEDLAEKNPIGEDGWWGVVGTTDSIWAWDSDTSAWVDTSAKTTLGDYLSRDQVIDLLAGKADVDHTHAWGAITGKPSSFPPEAHTHDDRYYTESEMDSKLNAKANSSHSHNYAGSNSAGGTANSVNGFTFSAQTGDPGAWSNLGTNRVLLVYE